MGSVGRRGKNGADGGQVGEVIGVEALVVKEEIKHKNFGFKQAERRLQSFQW